MKILNPINSYYIKDIYGSYKEVKIINIKINDRLFNLTFLNITVKKEHLEYNFKDRSTINIEL